MDVIRRLRERQEIQLVRVAHRADARLSTAWWLLVVVQGALPAVFAIAMGVLVGAVQRDAVLTGPLIGVGVLFVLMQVGSPVVQAVSRALGERTGAWLYDELSRAATEPPGMGHLEDPKLVADLTVAREFDAGMTGPPLYISVDFIATSLMQLVSGVVSVVLLFGYRWWAAPLLGGAWATTHWWLKESAVWRDRNTEEVRSAQRDSEYAYRLAVDPPAAKELRLFGLAGWTLDRFLTRRQLLHDLQYEATRLRERSVLGCLVVVVAANAVVAWSLSDALAVGSAGPRPGRDLRPGDGRRRLDRLRRAQLGARRGVGSGRRGAPPQGEAGAGRGPAQRHAPSPPRGRTSCASATWASPTPAGVRCSTASTSRSRPARRSPSSARTGRARPRWPSCSAASTTRRRGPSSPTASTSVTSTSTRGAARSPRCSRTSSASSCRCATTSLPAAPPTSWSARRSSGRVQADLADLDTPLSKGYAGRHRPLRRPVAAGRAGPGAVRRAAGRRGGAPRRAHRPARRARARRRSSSGCWPPPVTARRSSCRTGSRPCARPTASASSRPAGWSSSARTTS